MNSNETITKLQATFRRFDESAKPQGLYAISEFRGQPQPDPVNWAEWKFIFQPALADLGFVPSSNHIPAGAFSFRSNGNQRLLVQFVRLSKVKVRKYGNRYRLDPHADFADRWQEARVATFARTLARNFEGQERLLVLLGFAHEAQPFQAEIKELQSGSPRDFALAQAAIESWPDPQDRGFRTLCACWHWRP